MHIAVLKKTAITQGGFRHSGTMRRIGRDTLNDMRQRP